MHPYTSLEVSENNNKKERSGDGVLYKRRIHPYHYRNDYFIHLLHSNGKRFLKGQHFSDTFLCHRVYKFRNYLDFTPLSILLFIICILVLFLLLFTLTFT